ncbi:MAG TPA: methionine--tRNA ligase [Terriglobia bacterium]|nr:methionine--tRNA ligase [Terriglobia bacterium]
MADKTFYLTTPIYYPNARPHVGSAYTTIVCDVIARYKRMCGYDVAFLTGTDEHGEKLQRAAEAAGMSPADFVASKRELFRTLWRFLNISDYRFVHTSQNPDHIKSVQWIFEQAGKNGYIDKRRYEGRYCISDERYVSDNTDPVNCDICGRPAELISEDNYFFKLSAFEKQLVDLYEKHPEFVKPDYRMNEVKSFVKSGLRDISISRKRLKWGIPWPGDPNQVFYVWCDALTSYMTGIGFGSDDPARKTEFQKYWRNKPDEAEIVHMIGKDILRFHAVYWPAFIMAAYPDQPEMLPTTVFAHGWIYYEEDKMSKSKGNVVYPEPIVQALDSFGAPGNDALRYYLLRETTFGQDTSFSYDALIQRYNSDLANGLGNLASRTVAMLHQFCGGKLPAPIDPSQYLSPRQMITRVREDFDQFDFSSGLDDVWGQISEANKLIVQNKPWELANSSSPADREKLLATLSSVAQVLRVVSVLLYPVLPESAKRLWNQLGGHLRGLEQMHADLERQNINGALLDVLLAQDMKVGNPEPIFPRLDKEKTLARLHELADADFDRDKPKVGALHEVPLQANLTHADQASGAPKEASKSVSTDPTKPIEPQTSSPESRPVPTPDSQLPTPGPSKISIEDFAKVEMRVGEVLSAEPIPGATKLLKLQVDIGTEVRQVCAGIAEYYPPEQLVGMKVILVTNLQPRKLRGVESNGMILAASVGDKGKPILATFKEDVPKGAKLK